MLSSKRFVGQYRAFAKRRVRRELGLALAHPYITLDLVRSLLMNALFKDINILVLIIISSCPASNIR